MVRGIVHKNRPVIKLTVGWGQKTQKVVTLVDTGFTGELKLSEKEDCANPYGAGSIS